MRFTPICIIAAAAGIGLAACSSGSERQRASTADTTGMAGMKMDSTHMGGMPMGHMPVGNMGDMMRMMGQMRPHMDSMAGMTPAQLRQMLPMHRQKVANMLNQMQSDMRGMHMTGDTAWTATVDSVRQDLVRMPEMSPSELKAAMPQHAARVMRLMQMHSAMMGGKAQ